ncbi:sulfite exporter TauE/SafE family protein [Bacillus infantis]|uniref:Probable membrane transporter protein n=1 Tax=Bacillus infantis TaxID=324767 RepID=A0A5D4RN06_9BACI|nr:sulfite exporter TauE/SafE family protein [Bacillus infantis]TYS51204.1 sulfite exporter TauE/SafE family protein [Bacillus infantis]
MKHIGDDFIYILYLSIGLIASTLGAIAGLGGGVIIKPVLDLFGHFDLPTIGVLSAATVLAMAAASLIKMRKKELEIDKTASSFIAGGSILGGITGKSIFNLIAISLEIPAITAIIQSSILAVLLSLIFIYFKRKHQIRSYILKNKLGIISVGFLLGFLSAFLGIGGGPLNVAVLCLLFSMSAKNAGINSIFIIFFSQLSALLLIAFSSGFEGYNLNMLYLMIPGGIAGGIIGSEIVIKLSDSQVERIFSISIILIIIINVFNIVKVALIH